MRIGELADRSGVPPKTLRFYEQAGVLSQPRRSGSGYRDYDDSALARLQFVRAAQAAGLTLAEVRQVIAIREDTGAPCAHVTDLLDKQLIELDQRIAELTGIRTEVQRLRKRARTLDPGTCGDQDVCNVFAQPDQRVLARDPSG
jgi:MerR family copper efflux transcriptional regulator